MKNTVPCYICKTHTKKKICKTQKKKIWKTLSYICVCVCVYKYIYVYIYICMYIYF